MHILFGKEQADALAHKYTVLELDTFKLGENGVTVASYCIVENIPFDELTNLAESRIQHEHVLINYRGRRWADAVEGIDSLVGKWGGELDSFYADLRSRLENYIKQEPPVGWTPVIQK